MNLQEQIDNVKVVMESCNISDDVRKMIVWEVYVGDMPIADVEDAVRKYKSQINYRQPYSVEELFFPIRSGETTVKVMDFTTANLIDLFRKHKHMKIGV